MDTVGTRLNDAAPSDWDKAQAAARERLHIRSGEADRPRAIPAVPSVHPDNNPKTRVGALKAPMHLIPPSAEIYLAEALGDGASKYGAYNWRTEAISMSVYVGAIKRHLAAFVDGEDDAPDSGVHHLAHVMACCALMLDADSIGKLNDDRPPAGAAVSLLETYRSKQG